LATVSSREIPPHRELGAEHGIGEAISERPGGLREIRVGETTIAAGVQIDEPLSLVARDRGEFVPPGGVAQGDGETVGAVKGMAESRAPQGRPCAPLREPRMDPLEMSQQGATRMRDPARAVRGQPLRQVRLLTVHATS